MSLPISRAPSAITLASLCSRASCADSGSATRAQRQAGLRLTAIEMPMPEPQTAMPRSASAGGERLGELAAVIGIIDAFGAVGAEVGDLVALLAEPGGELVLEHVSGMVGGEGDAHGRMT